MLYGVGVHPARRPPEARIRPKVCGWKCLTPACTRRCWPEGDGLLLVVMDQLSELAQLAVDAPHATGADRLQLGAALRLASNGRSGPSAQPWSQPWVVADQLQFSPARRLPSTRYVRLDSYTRLRPRLRRWRHRSGLFIQAMRYLRCKPLVASISSSTRAFLCRLSLP
jgi:hypothetical protein